MFRKKNKKKSLEKCIEEFDIQFTPEYGREYENVDELYKYIKNVYENKIDSKEIDITVEKLRLEMLQGKYHGDVFKSSWGILAGIVIALTSFGIQIGVKGFEKYGDGIASISIVVIIIGIIYFCGRDVRKINAKDFMIFVSLKVLDDIEKENIGASNSAIEEIAVTQIEEKSTSFKILDKIKRLIFNR